VIKDSHMISITMEKLMSVCTWQWESLAVVHCWQVYQWQFENRLIAMNFEGSKLSYAQFSMTTMVEIIATRCIWLWTPTNLDFNESLKFISLCQQLFWEHPPIGKSENQLYWCISILSVMGKSEMWGHLHPSQHKLQTKIIATYCYQQRLSRILRLIDREQPCIM
jgi:hypothetical protein